LLPKNLLKNSNFIYSIHNKNNSKIDIVAHGNDFDAEKLKLYYGVPIDLGIFRSKNPIFLV
jgi:hypothetical protein